MDKQAARFFLPNQSRCIRFIEIPAGQNDLRAVVPDGVELLERGVFGHKDERRYFQKRRGKGDPLTMVTRRGGDDTVDQVLSRLGKDEVECATDLEGSGTLQVFALEKDGQAKSFAERVRGNQFGTANFVLESFGCFLDELVVEHEDSWLERSIIIAMMIVLGAVM